MANFRPPTYPFLSTWLLNAPSSIREFWNDFSETLFMQFLLSKSLIQLLWSINFLSAFKRSTGGNLYGSYFKGKYFLGYEFSKKDIIKIFREKFLRYFSVILFFFQILKILRPYYKDLTNI